MAKNKSTKTSAKNANKSIALLRRQLNRLTHDATKTDVSGAERDKILDEELRRIGVQVKQALTRINKEVDKSKTLDEDALLQSKLEKTIDILTNELMQLAAAYHRQKDVVKIRQFLAEQREVISKAMGGESAADRPKMASLDTRMEELHKLMSEERLRIKRASQKEALKFWVSVTIGLISLTISLIALASK